MKKDPRITDLKLPVWHDDDSTLLFYHPKNMLKMISRQHPWRLAPDSKKKAIHDSVDSQGASLAIMPEVVSFGGPWYKLFFPFIAITTLTRWLVMASCKVPVWPDWVEAECAIEANDPYDLPKPEFKGEFEKRKQAK